MGHSGIMHVHKMESKIFDIAVVDNRPFTIMM